MATRGETCRHRKQAGKLQKLSSIEWAIEGVASLNGKEAPCVGVVQLISSSSQTGVYLKLYVKKSNKNV
jgi:hypothetical protein